MTTITFTPKTLERLRKKYKAAVAAGEEKFTFEDQELVVSYARHLIDYLDGEFGSRR